MTNVRIYVMKIYNLHIFIKFKFIIIESLLISAKLFFLSLTLQDFQDHTTILEEEVRCRGHIYVYLPKFHYELNPIEPEWCHSKKHTRGHCNGTITRLRRIVPESLSLVTTDTIGCFFTKCRDYEAAYRDGHTFTSVDEAVKMYKSHRRLSQKV